MQRGEGTRHSDDAVARRRSTIEPPQELTEATRCGELPARKVRHPRLTNARERMTKTMNSSSALLLGATLALALSTTGCKRSSEESTEASAKPTATATATATVEAATVEAAPEVMAADTASAAAPPPKPKAAPQFDICDQVLRAAAAGKCTEARNLVPTCTGPKALQAKSSIVACLKGAR